MVLPSCPAAGPPAVDVIVVGAGLSGGLPAAAYLQKAGLQVLIIEANAEQSRVHETMVEFNELSSFSPHPDPGKLFARGQGAFGTTFALYYTTGVGIGGNEVQVDALTRCFLGHGGQLWTSAAVEEVLVENDRAVGVDGTRRARRH